MDKAPKEQVTCACAGTCIIKRILTLMVIVTIAIFIGLMVVLRFGTVTTKAATIPANTITHQCPASSSEKPNFANKVKETNVYYLVYVNRVNHELYHIDSFPTEEECFDARASPDYRNFITEAIGVEDPELICQVSRMAFDSE